MTHIKDTKPSMAHLKHGDEVATSGFENRTRAWFMKIATVRKI